MFPAAFSTNALEGLGTRSLTALQVSTARSVAFRMSTVGDDAPECTGEVESVRSRSRISVDYAQQTESDVKSYKFERRRIGCLPGGRWTADDMDTRTAELKQKYTGRSDNPEAGKDAEPKEIRWRAEEHCQMQMI